MNMKQQSARTLTPVQCPVCRHRGHVDAAAISGRNAVALRCSRCGSSCNYRHGVAVKDVTQRRRLRARRRAAEQRRDAVGDLFDQARR
jgi:transcription elongation factor Elf1